MGDKWFEKTVESSKIRCREYRSGDFRERARYQYWKGISCYALGDEDTACSYMETAAEYDNPEALYWLSNFSYDSKNKHRYVYDRESWPREISYAYKAKEEKSLDAIVDLAERIRGEHLENGDEIIRSLYAHVKEYGTEEAVFAWMIHLEEQEFQSTMEKLMNSTLNSPKARMYRRMAYLAKALSRKNMEDMLAFADFDLDKNATYKFNDETNGNLLKKAYNRDLKAITGLGKIYFHRKDPWMYNALGDAMLDYVSQIYELRYDSGDWREQDIIDWYFFENAIHERKKQSYDIFESGLNHHISYFCVNAYWLREELDLDRSDIKRYLEIAKIMVTIYPRPLKTSEKISVLDEWKNSVKSTEESRKNKEDWMQNVRTSMQDLICWNVTWICSMAEVALPLKKKQSPEVHLHWTICAIRLCAIS